jgi:hypothetical protein
MKLPFRVGATSPSLFEFIFAGRDEQGRSLVGGVKGKLSRLGSVENGERYNLHLMLAARRRRRAKRIEKFSPRKCFPHVKVEREVKPWIDSV